VTDVLPESATADDPPFDPDTAELVTHVQPATYVPYKTEKGKEVTDVVTKIVGSEPDFQGRVLGLDDYVEVRATGRVVSTKHLYDKKSGELIRVQEVKLIDVDFQKGIEPETGVEYR
jgi:hypothetical protein